MHEVSVQTAAMLVDSLTRQGVETAQLFADLPFGPTQLAVPRGRIDWEVWAEAMARVERAVGVEKLETLFASGAGARTGHAFVRLANAFLSIHDVYALFARWGLTQSLMVMSARFDAAAPSAQVVVDIDPARPGSLPTLRFITGILRSLPTLQGLPAAHVRMLDGATPHHAVYDIDLPPERSLLSRTRRAVRMIGGAAAALDELEEQASLIALKNHQLEAQLAELQRATTALRERDQWLELALDAGRTGTWRYDVHTNEVRLSNGLARLLGLPGDAAIPAAKWTARIHSDDRDEIARIMRAAIAARTTFDAEYRIVPAPEELRWIRIQGRVVTDATGATAESALGTVTDVTEQKVLDTRLRFADRLISAGTLAAGVAHEINNPLTWLLGNIDIIQHELAAEPLSSTARASTARSLDDMVDGLTRIRDIVSDLRAFSRPAEESVQPLDLSKVCDAAIRILSPSVRHRAVVRTVYALDTPWIIANESRIGQVVVNLILNASQAMPARPAAENVILVRTARGEDGGAIIEVEDNGTGIPPGVLPKLFDPFFTTKPVGDGTGLGLSVCQSIVTALHGTIDVDTAVGRGTTFRVRIPPAPAERVNAPRSVPPAMAARPPPGVARVLVVDDEPSVRRAISHVLRARGFAVAESKGGRDAVAQILETDFTAIVCDLMMPEMSGDEVWNEVFRQRPDQARRMIFISGGTVTQQTRAFASREDIVLLDKPLDFRLLVDAINAINAVGRDAASG